MQVVDVGASRGEFSSFMADISGVEVLAIEPLPDIAASIPKRKNISVAVLAIRDVDEPKTDTILRRKNSELSSFLENERLVDTQLWEHHLSGAPIDDRLQTPVESLEFLMQRLEMGKIDLLKIDAQGIDLEVLRSARSRLCDIRVVALEAPYIDGASLYADEDSMVEVVLCLDKMGFWPVRLAPNGGGEGNIIAVNKRESVSSYLELEEFLRLRECPTLKIGVGGHLPFKDRLYLLLTRLPTMKTIAYALRGNMSTSSSSRVTRRGIKP